MAENLGAIFNQGFANGIAARRSRDARKQQEWENQRQDRLDAESRLDSEVNRRRKEQLASEMEIEIQAKRDDAKRFVEASTAFDKFAAAESLIDWSSDSALATYQAVKRSYLPDIMKHDSQFKKFQILDGLNQKRDAVMTQDTLNSSVQLGMREAAKVAPDLLIELQQGKLSPVDFSQRLRDRQDEINQQEIALRRAPWEARMDAETAGAYGGRSKSGLPPGINMELQSIGAELKKVNELLLDPKATPDQKRDLLNRKGSLQRRLRNFDAMLPQRPRTQPTSPAKPSAPPAPSAPEAPEAPAVDASKTITTGVGTFQLIQ